MSDLTNFQSNEAWRNILKKFLTMERSAADLKAKASTEQRRLIVDVEVDLKNLVEKQKQKVENIDADAQLNLESSTSNIGQKREWQHISDESFEALERMCNKTVSDPNSTLFRYVHADQKDQILAAAKKFNMNIKPSTPQDANLLEKLKDCTLLDEVEAPSNLWESTVTSNNTFYTSPVKMVGLLRPSTILEETTNCNGDSENPSPDSSKTLHSRSTEDYGISSVQTFESVNVIEGKNKSRIISPAEHEVQLNENCSTFSEMHGSFHLEKSPSQSLIGAVCSPTPPNDGDNCLDMSVIEILSDEEHDQESNSTENISNIPNPPSIDDNIEAKISSCPIMESTDYANHHEFRDNDKENCIDITSESNMEFNDTIEEVEYIIKKGMQYMAKVDAKNNSEKKQAENVLQKSTAAELSLNRSISPKKKRTDIPKKAPSPFKVPLETKKSEQKTDTFTIKPFPKLNLFVKPKKDTSKKPFEHIVSPIGTYMKKTATTPLMTNMKSRQINKDLLNSSAFRNLEYESRLKPSTSYKSTLAAGSILLGKCTAPKTLSKKAYISSNLKHIVDERTPITIPGGQKIQKYLENAAIPAVLKHEGKVKLNEGSNMKLASKESTSPSEVLPWSSRRDDLSIAQLSVMSGDLSLYTIVDAQKF